MKRLFPILTFLILSLPLMAGATDYPFTTADIAAGVLTIDTTTCSGINSGGPHTVTLTNGSYACYIYINGVRNANGVTIQNDGGVVLVDGDATYGAVRIYNSAYVTISGSNHVGTTYGFKLTSANYGIRTVPDTTYTLESDNLTFHHVWIDTVTNVGIQSHPHNSSTARASYTQTGPIIHDCKITNVGSSSGEAMYIGSTSWTTANSIPSLENVQIYNNVIDGTYADGIQVQSAAYGTNLIYGNDIDNIGTGGGPPGTLGITIGAGSNVRIYGNNLKTIGTHGIYLNQGTGYTAYAYNNIVEDVGQNDGSLGDGIRAQTGANYVYCNTIVDPETYGIQAGASATGTIQGNICVGTAATVSAGSMTSADNYNGTVASVNFTDAANSDFTLTATTPVTILDILEEGDLFPSTDYAGTARPQNYTGSGQAFADLGAYEIVPASTPVVSTCPGTPNGTDVDQASQATVSRYTDRNYLAATISGTVENVCKIEIPFIKVGSPDVRGYTLTLAEWTLTDGTSLTAEQQVIATVNVGNWTSKTWISFEPASPVTITLNRALVLYMSAFDSDDYVNTYYGATANAGFGISKHYGSDLAFKADANFDEIAIKVYTGGVSDATRSTIAAVGWYDAETDTCVTNKDTTISIPQTITLCAQTNEELIITIPGPTGQPTLTVLPGPATASTAAASWAGYYNTGSATILKFNLAVTPGMRASDLSAEAVTSLSLGLSAVDNSFTVTRGDPTVITDAGHGLSTGDFIYFKALGELTALVGKQYAITYIGANSFSVDVDTSGEAADEADDGDEEYQSSTIEMRDAAYNLLNPDLTAAGVDLSSSAIVLAVPWDTSNKLRIPGDYADPATAEAAGVTPAAGSYLEVGTVSAVLNAWFAGTALAPITVTLADSTTVATGAWTLDEDYWEVDGNGGSVVGGIKVTGAGVEIQDLIIDGGLSGGKATRCKLTP